MTEPNPAGAARPHGPKTREALDLIERREALKMRSEELRHRLAFRSASIKPALQATDRVADGVDWVKRHPGLVAVVGAAVLGAVLARPRAFMRLGGRAFAAWQLVQRAQPVVRAFMRQR